MSETRQHTSLDVVAANGATVIGMTFEIVAVVPSKKTREVVAPFLDSK